MLKFLKDLLSAVQSVDSTPRRTVPPQTRPAYEGRCNSTAEDFYALLSEAFPQCTLERSVDAARLDGTLQGRKAMPVTLLLSRDGRPKVGILLVPKKDYRRPWVKKTMNACTRAGAVPQRYFVEFSNRDQYVIARVSEALGL